MVIIHYHDYLAFGYAILRSKFAGISRRDVLRTLVGVRVI